MIYVSDMFSPMMLGTNVKANMIPINFKSLKYYIDSLDGNFESIIAHKSSAEKISKMLNISINSKKGNVNIESGDIIFCLLPRFNKDKPIKNSMENVNGLNWRFFKIQTSK